MKHLLIATIARQCRPRLDTWWHQLVDLSAHLGAHGWSFELSVAENDSTDGTAEWLRNLKPQVPYHLSTETLGTVQYPSVWSIDRIRNLAGARQKCLDQAGDLSRFSKVAYIEVDVSYDPSWAAELVLAQHPAAAGIEPDIYSGWSLRSLSHPKESTFLYDTCATRATSGDICWDIGESGGRWRGQSLVPTGLPGVYANSLHRVWSTFNCLCVYNARPFYRPLRWNPEWGPISYLLRRMDAIPMMERWTRVKEPALQWGIVNHRVDPSGIPMEDGDHGSGWLDADTSVMCERFRAAGYGNILINTNVLVRHA